MVFPSAPAPDTEANQELMVAWLAHFPGATSPIARPDYRFWSGNGDMTFYGEKWLGTGEMIGVGTVEETLDVPDRRMTLTISLPEQQAIREAFLQDPGPLLVEVRWIYSKDQGLTWLLLPKVFVGRLSRPQIDSGVYTIELETFRGDVDRGRPARWSDADQRKEFPGDRGMEYMAQLESGFEVAWPP